MKKLIKENKLLSFLIVILLVVAYLNISLVIREYRLEREYSQAEYRQHLREQYQEKLKTTNPYYIRAEREKNAENDNQE